MSRASVASDPALPPVEPTAGDTLAEPEPFGLLGVRQFIWPSFLISMVLLGVVASLLWYRSTRSADVVLFRADGGVFAASSAYGRLTVERTEYQPDWPKYLRGWAISTRHISVRSVDAWQPSLGKTLGAEYFTLNVRNDKVSGWRFRVRYWIVIVACLLPATVRSVRRRRRGLSFFEPATQA